MEFKYLDFAYKYRSPLLDLIMNATLDLKNQWFFVNGAFDSCVLDNWGVSTQRNDHFVVYDKKRDKIVGYIETIWDRLLDIVDSVRIICFEPLNPMMNAAMYEYFDYIFLIRKAFVVNWCVAEKNEYTKRIHDKFCAKTGGRCIGRKSHSIKGYSGEICDSFLYELTRDAYIENIVNKRKEK